MKYTKSLITVLVLACGCDDLIPRGQRCGPTKSAITLTNSAVISFNAEIDQNGSITFRSWNGEWIGTDCDTELQFTANGHVQMTEFDFGRETYDGLYHIDDNGKIRLKFSADLGRIYGGSFPDVILSADPKSLAIRPDVKGLEYKEYGRKGETVAGYYWMYWPFRRVDAPHGRI